MSTLHSKLMFHYDSHHFVQLTHPWCFEVLIRDCRGQCEYLHFKSAAKFVLRKQVSHLQAQFEAPRIFRAIFYTQFLSSRRHYYCP